MRTPRDHAGDVGGSSTVPTPLAHAVSARDDAQMRGFAEETLKICDSGSLALHDGRVFEIGDAIERAKIGTRLYTPSDAFPLSARSVRSQIEVTTETTSAAAFRLGREGVDRVAMLNFASARNPGGGFLGGAKAQEEDLCRASALYVCLVTQPAYYEANRVQRSLLYTDHAIYSPDVPFFRDDTRALCPPYLASVITSPAPNGAELKRDPNAPMRETFTRRARQVLSIAEQHAHTTIVLGAWGCGAFRNDPNLVADVFAQVVQRAPFDRIVFAIAKRSVNFDVFSARLSSS